LEQLSIVSCNIPRFRISNFWMLLS